MPFWKRSCPSNLVDHDMASTSQHHIIIPSPTVHSIRALGVDHFLSPWIWPLRNNSYLSCRIQLASHLEAYRLHCLLASQTIQSIQVDFLMSNLCRQLDWRLVQLQWCITTIHIQLSLASCTVSPVQVRFISRCKTGILSSLLLSRCHTQVVR